MGNLYAQSYQYEYDDLGRITRVIYPSGVYVKYYYDAVGNRILKLENSFPITLLDLKGTPLTSVVQLQWTTAQERNSSHFEVQHASTQSGTFQTFDEVAAAGNSTEQLNYEAIHHQPVIGNNYYRLKMSDIEGNFDYSNTINVPFSPTENALILYPNPAQTELILQFAFPLKVYEVKTCDMIGAEINSVKIADILANYKLNVSTLSEGTYTIKVITDTKTYYQKFVVIR